MIRSDYGTAPELEPLVAVVTGTHCAGKTTLVSEFADDRLIRVFKPLQLVDLHERIMNYQDLEYGIPNIGDGRYPLFVPTVVVPETATEMANFVSNPRIWSTEYHLSTQLICNEFQRDRLLRAMEFARALFVLVRERMEGTNVPLARRPLVLTDRGTLDGQAYAAARYPEIDVDVIAGMRETNKNIAHHQVGQDITFVADPEGVPFEPRADRLASEQIRIAMGKAILDAYRRFSVEGQQLVILKGNREERAKSIRNVLRAALRQDLPEARRYDWRIKTYLEEELSIRPEPVEGLRVIVDFEELNALPNAA